MSTTEEEKSTDFVSVKFGTDAQMLNIAIDKFIDNGWDWELNYGYPQDKNYTDRNTQMFQCTDKAPRKVIEYANDHFQKFTLTMIKQPPAQFVPEHKDKYYLFQQKYNLDDNSQIVRYCVFLEDRKPGHYFEVNGKPLIDWKAGDVAVLRPGIYHRSANAGTEFKYTAQITGLLN